MWIILDARDEYVMPQKLTLKDDCMDGSKFLYLYINVISLIDYYLIPEIIIQ